LSKFWFVVIFLVVFGLHIFALLSNIQKTTHVVKPKTKITKITLSSVVVQKPTPPKPKVEPKKEKKRLLEPIILPPDPVIEPEVKVIEPKVEVKKPKRYEKKRKRKPKKRVAKKPDPIPVQEVQEVIQVQKPLEQDTSNIKDRYTSLIRRLIRDNLYYPKAAKRMRIQGIVKVAFVVGKNGSISGIRVISGTKSILKKGAVKTIEAISVPPIPQELGLDHMNLNIPIEFKIKG